MRYSDRAAGPAALMLAAASVWMLGAGGAEAQGSDKSWMRVLGSAYASNEPIDRELIKEWEANPDKGFATLSPSNIMPLKAAIIRYTGIVAKGGWRPLPDQKLQSGANHPAVAILRERLAMSGELSEAGSSQSFDHAVEKAVRRYQATNGLAPTGVIDRYTIAAMNVPAAARLKQLKTNLTRVQEYAKTPGKYILVNIPAAQVEAVENNTVVSRHAGVVGKIDRQTPILKSAVHELNFNAVWTLPPTVIEKDLIPKGQEMAKRGQSALVKYKIDAYGGDGRKLDPTKVNWSSGAKGLTYRQQPGPENPLGFVKMNFHNAHSVYMHDTPGQSLFSRNFRAASSGCVRIGGIENLAAWVVAEQGWRPEHVQQMKENRERRDVKLHRPIPLYFAYITAWATQDGTVHFRRDIYQKDGVGEQAAAY
ncbi:MAG: L,D-transpeptidase family protein [Hyphomonadaceae bacterium]|nr:L,D-transpeptidase family protein [Hyphomonadaceae bacterium]